MSGRGVTSPLVYGRRCSRRYQTPAISTAKEIMTPRRYLLMIRIIHVLNKEKNRTARWLVPSDLWGAQSNQVEGLSRFAKFTNSMELVNLNNPSSSCE